MELFDQIPIGSCLLNNRIIRSATFEGMCDDEGIPTQAYFDLYEELSKKEIGAIITGFANVSENGKAIQPGQAGIYHPKLIPFYKEISEVIHANGSKWFMQIAHAGRQTRKQETGMKVVGVSSKKSTYFGGKPVVLSTAECYDLIDDFGQAAYNAMEAGFDGVQIHAAHGYLIHQFLLPTINNRNDEFGINRQSKIGFQFLEKVIEVIRQKCGRDFPVLVKISGSDDYAKSFSTNQFIQLIQALDKTTVDAIEISYGTMDNALNIFRGDIPDRLILKYNKVYGGKPKFESWLFKRILFPIFKTKVKAFSPMYNLKFAELAKQHTAIPIITVGGFTEQQEMETTVSQKRIDFIGLSRPFIADPDLVLKMKAGTDYRTNCVYCNSCAIMCDSKQTLKCYKRS